jgi:predicted RNA methylase
MPAIPDEIRKRWDELEDDNDGRVEFAYKHHEYSHLLTAGITLPSFREELEWILARFDEGLPDGDVLDVGAGAGVTAAVVSLATKRDVVACDPAAGAGAAITYVGDSVGVKIRPVEATVSELPSTEFEVAATVIAQSILTYFGFGDEQEDDGLDRERSALVSVLSTVGDALVIEHATDVTNPVDGSATWTSFVASMSEARMYPVWDTAVIASGYNVLMPDVPAYERPMYARPKLCLWFSKSGDPQHAEARLADLLAQHPLGAGWTD